MGGHPVAAGWLGPRRGQSEKEAPLHWHEYLATNQEALADLLAWIAKRDIEIVRKVFAPGPPPSPEVLSEARGAKKVLDELAQSATMMAREEQANARHRRNSGP